jgi:hypothetical protein
MQSWTVTGFTGHHSELTAAVVTADNSAKAAHLLEEYLAKIGRPQHIGIHQMIPLKDDKPRVTMLLDGLF